MPLHPGDKLGPYEIVAPLGAGGMGEVYRAHDARLNRDVAIKTLPAAFAEDASRMARFQREAQVLAALNHPHIASIYGIEDSAIVMELVEGKNLAGPLPVDEAIAIARQIADALDAAHQKNIIHRDLKPANVKITPEGSVKVLDFGLAKAFDTNLPSSDPAVSPTVSPTITMESTRAGVILGTAGYMSPEQARGKTVDKRADIWSFGVVFYELLTGERAFEGETVSDTLAAVLRADLDWKKLPAATPIGVRLLLERCLHRDPNKRLRDIGDAWNDMDRVADAAPPSRMNWVPSAMAAVLSMALAAVTWEFLHVPPPEPRSVTRSQINVPNRTSTPTLSRDGSRMVYIMNTGGRPQLALRMMDQLDGKAIPGDIYGVWPEFSPDGQWIAYISYPAPFQLKKVPVTGGTPITLCDVSYSFVEGRSDWGLDDTIIFGSPKGLMRVPAAGGAPQPLTSVDTTAGETRHDSPAFLPGGQKVLFTAFTGASLEASRIAVVDLKTGITSPLPLEGVRPHYVPSGHLTYVREGTLYAVPFDLNRLKVTGTETPVAERISFNAYSFSDSGVVVFTTVGDLGGSTLHWTDRKGSALPIAEAPHHWVAFELSTDGKRIVGSIYDEIKGLTLLDIWILDLERRTLTRVTFDGGSRSPIWTPDGRSITFGSFLNGKAGIYQVAADRSGPPELLLTTDAPPTPRSWTPDGKTLLYTQSTGGKVRIWIWTAGGQPRLFSQTSFDERVPALSPDGKWLAYDSNESGKDEIYVEPFPGPGGRSHISTQGGLSPVWSRNGRELFYREPSTNVEMAVEISTGPVFRAGHPEALFKMSGTLPTDTEFTVTPDPKRFLVERMPDGSTIWNMVTITDWFDDLRRKAPLKK